MRLSERWRAGARLVILSGTVLLAASGGAAAQTAGYVVIGGGTDNGAPDAEKTSSIQAPEAFPSIQEIPPVNAIVPEPARTHEAAARPMTEAEKNVRVVGPKFLPDPEEAIDLRAPGRNRAR